jgi:hypothetical protein
MISDEDVIQFFKKVDTPGGYEGEGIPQIFWGKMGVADAFVGGCRRHHMVFNKFRVIPEYCFDCYKVLVAPRTVVELFKLMMVFDALRLPKDNFRKCMVEGRNDCSGTYKGFVFCVGKEDGKAVREIVREAVWREISPEIPITMKRGCSEFAAAYPSYSPTKPGAVWLKYNKDWKVHEDFIDKNIVVRRDPSPPNANDEAQTTGVSPEIFAMKYWLRYAATIGDMSYLKLAGGHLPPIPNLKRPPFAGVRAAQR